MLYRLAGVRERIASRHEYASTLRERLRVELAETEAAVRSGPSPAELEAAANEATAAARAAAHERDDLRERATIARERLASLERSLAEREGIPPAARRSRARAPGSRSRCSRSRPETSGRSRPRSRWRASALVASDPEAGLALLEQAREAGLGSLAVLVGRTPAERVADLPVVPLADLLSATGLP